MGEVVTALGWIFLAFSIVGSGYSLAAGLALRWFFARATPVASDFPSVTILKPLHGDEPGLRACLEGFCTQDYPAPVQIVFGVRDASDSAIAVVSALKADHPRLAIELVVDGRLYGSNLKISNLINMERRIRHGTVVLADSDVSVGPDYLRRLVGALSAPGVGYVSCAYLGVPTGNVWSRLSAMAINYHQLPSVALGLRLRLAEPCFGPTIAFEKRVLDRVGGFRRFADHLADDFEFGRAVRELGYGFTIPPLLIGHGCPERSARSLLSHEVRWARTIRLIDPVTYVGSLICHPLPLVLVAAALLHASIPSLTACGVVIASRVFVTAQVDQIAGGRVGSGWLSPVRDLLSVGVYLSAFFVRTVTWRGRRFRIGRDGVLLPFDHSPAPELLEAA